MNKEIFPKQITIELTNECNYKCVMCPRNHFNMKTGFMSEVLFEKILSEIQGKKIDVIPFFRGEALLHPDFIKFLSKIKTKVKGKILLATNGSLLTEKISDAVSEIGIDFISFSLDSINEETYKKIRGVDTLKTVLKNIDYFLNKAKDKVVTQASAVAINGEQNQKEKFVEYWKNKVDRVRIYCEHSSGGSFGRVNEDSENRIQRKSCHKPFQNIVICWNGDIALCNHDWKAEEFGFNAKIKSINEIWNSEEYELIRKNHIENNFSTESVCFACDHWLEFYDDSIKGELYLTKKTE